MAVLILYGYLMGLGVGVFTVVTAAVALSLPVPPPLAFIAAFLGPLSTARATAFGRQK